MLELVIAKPICQQLFTTEKVLLPVIQDKKHLLVFDVFFLLARPTRPTSSFAKAPKKMHVENNSRH